MTTHEAVMIITGATLVVGSPIMWRRFNLDGLIALIVFFVGLSILVEGHI